MRTRTFPRGRACPFLTRIFVFFSFLIFYFPHSLKELPLPRVLFADNSDDAVWGSAIQIWNYPVSSSRLLLFPRVSRAPTACHEVITPHRLCCRDHHSRFHRIQWPRFTPGTIPQFLLALRHYRLPLRLPSSTAFPGCFAPEMGHRHWPQGRVDVPEDSHRGP